MSQRVLSTSIKLLHLLRLTKKILIIVEQEKMDKLMIEMDGTASKIGVNVILGAFLNV